MHWQTEAIVIAKIKYSESSLIVTLLTEEKGLIKAFVKGAFSKKNVNLYEVGNLIAANLYYKSEDKLSYANAELITAYYAKIFHDKSKLLALKTAIEMINLLIPQGEDGTELYKIVKEFIGIILSNEFSLYDYLEFEIKLLSNIGFSLNFSKCVASGKTDDLYYLSPKSGNSVTYDIGLPYEDKLLKLPRYLLYRRAEDFTQEDFQNGMNMTYYFFTNFFLQGINKKLPEIRNILCRERINPI